MKESGFARIYQRALDRAKADPDDPLDGFHDLPLEARWLLIWIANCLNWRSDEEDDTLWLKRGEGEIYGRKHFAAACGLSKEGLTSALAVLHDEEFIEVERSPYVEEFRPGKHIEAMRITLRYGDKLCSNPPWYAERRYDPNEGHGVIHRDALDMRGGKADWLHFRPNGKRRPVLQRYLLVWFQTCLWRQNYKNRGTGERRGQVWFKSLASMGERVAAKESRLPGALDALQEDGLIRWERLRRTRDGIPIMVTLLCENQLAPKRGQGGKECTGGGRMGPAGKHPTQEQHRSNTQKRDGEERQAIDHTEKTPAPVWPGPSDRHVTSVTSTHKSEMGRNGGEMGSFSNEMGRNSDEMGSFTSEIAERIRGILEQQDEARRKQDEPKTNVFPLARETKSFRTGVPEGVEETTHLGARPAPRRLGADKGGGGTDDRGDPSRPPQPVSQKALRSLRRYFISQCEAVFDEAPTFDAYDNKCLRQDVEAHGVDAVKEAIRKELADEDSGSRCFADANRIEMKYSNVHINAFAW